MNDGGPAFPNMSQVNANGQHLTYATQGMSLRDYFAGQALASMTVAHDYCKGPCNAAMAERAYAIADAMLKAREERKS